MIHFNVPPYTGREMEYIRQAVENQKICGDGPFTKKCSEWIEEKTGAAKCDSFVHTGNRACGAVN